MLIQGNFRFQFYDVIKNERHIPIIVNNDVDALCATYILSHAFNCDDLTYSITPVCSRKTLIDALNLHKQQAKHIVLINCVGLFSLLELGIDYPEELVLFVLETRRPIHLDNIFNRGSINVLVYESEVDDWQIPTYDQLYEPESEPSSDEDDDESQDDDDDQSENDENLDETRSSFTSGGGSLRRKRKRRRTSNGSSPAGQKQRRRRPIADIIARRELKRQKKLAWKKTRATVVWEYYRDSWHGASLSVMMLELVHELGRSSAEMMWCASIGLTSMFADKLISIETYTENCIDRMRMFIRKYAPRADITLDQSRGDDQLRISFDNDLTLPMYAHWSLNDAMKNDLFFICRSRLWTQGREQTFRYIIAQLGLTRHECAQNYAALSSERRKEVFDIIYRHVNAGFATFISHIGYTANFSALDFCRALALKLEYKAMAPAPDPEQATSSESVVTTSSDICDRFNSARRILLAFFKPGGRDISNLYHAIDSYKQAIKAINELVCRSVQQGHVIAAARFFLLTVQQSPVIPYLITSRHCLFLFLDSLQLVYGATRANRRTKPLIIGLYLTEHDLPELEDTFGPSLPLLNLNHNQLYILVAGVMPLSEIVTDTSRKSVIGRAFVHIADELQIPAHKTFENNVVFIRAEDRTKFFNGLEARLEVV